MTYSIILNDKHRQSYPIHSSCDTLLPLFFGSSQTGDVIQMDSISSAIQAMGEDELAKQPRPGSKDQLLSIVANSPMPTQLLYLGHPPDKQSGNRDRFTWQRTTLCGETASVTLMFDSMTCTGTGALLIQGSWQPHALLLATTSICKKTLKPHNY